MAEQQEISRIAGKGYVFADGEKQATLKSFVRSSAYAVVKEILRWEAVQALKKLVRVPAKNGIGVAKLQEQIHSVDYFINGFDRVVEREPDASEVAKAVSG